MFFTVLFCGLDQAAKKWMDFCYPQKIPDKKFHLPANKKRRLPKEPPCLLCLQGMRSIWLPLYQTAL